MPDLIVVGAGPAGLATALYAARAGLETVVVEQRSGPIDKACGEGLMPAAATALGHLGVRLTGHPLRGIRYLDGRRSAEALFRGSGGLGVRRTALQGALADAARAAGVETVEGSVTSVSQDGGGVEAAGLRARWLVAADGLHSPLRHSLGLDVPVSRRHPRWGLRQHFAVAPWTDLVEVHWSRDAEAYVTPVADDLVGVAVLSGRRRSFAEHLDAFPALRSRLPAEGVTGVRGAGPLRHRSRRRVHGRVLLAGDAAGYVDALTGEGIAIALRSAQAIVDCLVAGDPGRYEREWRSASRHYRAITSSLVWVARQRALRRAIVPAASAAPAVFRTAVHQLAR